MSTSYDPLAVEALPLLRDGARVVLPGADPGDPRIRLPRAPRTDRLARLWTLPL